MPIYEYRCLSCENEFEKLLRRQSEEVACPSCKNKKLEKKFSLFAMTQSSSLGDYSAGGGSSCGSCVSKNCSSCG